MINTLLLTLAITGLVFPTLGYVYWCYKSFKEIPASYSDSYWMWEKLDNSGYRFTAWVSFQIAFILPSLIMLSKSPLYAIGGFLSLFCLAFVGLFPISIDKITDKWHCRFALSCSILAILWLILHGMFVMTYIIGFITLIVNFFSYDKYKTLLLEMGAFTATYLGIIILALQ